VLKPGREIELFGQRYAVWYSSAYQETIIGVYVNVSNPGLEVGLEEVDPPLCSHIVGDLDLDR
jgi:hypothetical protein